ncbi:hypothetical protein PRIPAC_81544 [Pristionchus pacificus]|uniref:Tyrosine kinase n=1 Tax=Pristionchus pacificus TaxID=54126 RepID=A0A2A6BHM1_PRIPA|nr:hypothetical protein PRIPAC_81544 [Pristionchus pacificus]|eukprot:PDM65394.1 Tyrosine kinase [Pristionchus pacificus]
MLGGTPYAGWPAAELLTRLKLGERMEKPDNCSDILYKLMCNCWSENPSQRPAFTSLRKQLRVLLENVSKDEYYLKLNPHAHYNVLESD